ncbi:MAG: hypothetical protein KUG78_19625 [Kangiellaceae bacterium]|nr:hypothetical protein [Kangiellaceae bacterium]
MLDWLTSLSGDARVALGMPFAIFMFYLGIKAMISIVKMWNNCIDKDNWGLFSSRIFNAEGNYHRKELYKYALSFILILGIIHFSIYLFGGFE